MLQSTVADIQEINAVDLNEGAAYSSNVVMRKAKIADHGQQETHVRRRRNAHSKTIPPGKGKAKDKEQEVLLTEERFQTLLVVTRK